MDKFLTPLSEERRSHLGQRQYGKQPDEQERPAKSYRTRGQRDRDRILYSSAFQRLAYVTQVTAPESGHAFHNRLGHSLKVAQVGRRNAERLQSLAKEGGITGAAATLVEAIDPDAVEASCLAHDLGHPPFGHIAEEVLHAEAAGYVSDGFEGNAQSFRIVTRLGVRAAEPGLNLTRQTLEGLMKYPWRHWPTDPYASSIRERKWGYYEDDVEAFRFAREHWPDETADALPERAFEAELMDWADDLTFAVHDVDDFFRAGLVPLDRLAQPKGSESKRLHELLTDAKNANPPAFPSYEVDELVEAAQRIIALHGPLEPYRHTINARAAMRDFGSDLITRYLEAFSVEDHAESGQVRLRIDDDALREIAALKLLVVVYVVRRPGLAVVQHGQQRVIRELFHSYFTASSPKKDEGDRRLFPPSAKDRLEAGPETASHRARVVVDLISGLTETAAVELHQRILGAPSAPTLDATALIG